MVHNRFHSGYMPWCGADVGGGYWTRDGSDTREQNVEKYRAFHDEDCGRVRAATDRDERDATEYYRCRACRDFFQRRLGRSRVRGVRPKHREREDYRGDTVSRHGWRLHELPRWRHLTPGFSTQPLIIVHVILR